MAANPAPYHSYAEKLRTPEWQEKRFKILDRDNRHCLRCGRGFEDGVLLHVHHLAYRSGCEPWEYPDEELQTLCDEHHLEAEGEKIFVLIALGDPVYRAAIIEICTTWQICSVCLRLKPPFELDGRNGKHEPICGQCCLQSEVLRDFTKEGAKDA